MGLVVKVTDIKWMKKCTLLSMHYRIIYSTNMFQWKVTDRKRKTGREKKKKLSAIRSRNCYTHCHFLTRLRWYDSQLFFFLLDLEHFFFESSNLNLFSTTVNCNSSRMPYTPPKMIGGQNFLKKQKQNNQNWTTIKQQSPAGCKVSTVWVAHCVITQESTQKAGSGIGMFEAKYVRF